MGSLGLLILEILLLTRITGQQGQHAPHKRVRLIDVFSIDFPEPIVQGQKTRNRPLPVQFILASVLVVSLSLLMKTMPQRQEIIPPRESFASFPLYIGEWQGAFVPMEQIYVDTLKFSDYALIDYRNAQGDMLNFYVFYYDSQRRGQSAHSPKSCIPGGGWKVDEFATIDVPELTINSESLKVNRVLTTKGDQRQLVYYWFKQRDRNLSNEYLVKWFLFWDALTKNRTDGSLVRVVLNAKEGTPIETNDLLVRNFIRDSYAQLKLYVPD